MFLLCPMSWRRSCSANAITYSGSCTISSSTRSLRRCSIW
ncbi:MAG: hypothetical protein II914_03730 [Clostridia bacterium]|nr:hypothetical protein [Clostridia bacterium]